MQTSPLKREEGSVNTSGGAHLLKLVAGYPGCNTAWRGKLKNQYPPARNRRRIHYIVKLYIKHTQLIHIPINTTLL